MIEFVSTETLDVELRTEEPRVIVGQEHLVVAYGDAFDVIEISSHEQRRVQLPEGIDQWHSYYSAMCPNGAFLAGSADGTAMILDLEKAQLNSFDTVPGRAKPLWDGEGNVVLYVHESAAALVDRRSGEVAIHEIVPSVSPYFALDVVRSLEDLPLTMCIPDPALSYPRTIDEAWDKLERVIGSTPEADRNKLLRDARPSVRLVHDFSGELPVKRGARSTRFGGMPDAPVGLEWPSQDGVRHSFFGQVNFADLAPLTDMSLHSSGHVLIFFRSPQNEGPNYSGADTILRYVAEDEAVEPLPWPTDLEQARRFPDRNMLLVPEITPHADQSGELSEIILHDVIGEQFLLPPPLHRMFGWGDSQNARELSLVLQIDADNHIPLEPWGDGGIGSYVIDSPGHLTADLSKGETDFTYS